MCELFSSGQMIVFCVGTKRLILQNCWLGFLKKNLKLRHINKWNINGFSHREKCCIVLWTLWTSESLQALHCVYLFLYIPIVFLPPCAGLVHLLIMGLGRSANFSVEKSQLNIIENQFARNCFPYIISERERESTQRLLIHWARWCINSRCREMRGQQIGGALYPKPVTASVQAAMVASHVCLLFPCIKWVDNGSLASLPCSSCSSSNKEVQDCQFDFLL